MVTLTAPIVSSRLRNCPRVEILGVFGSGKTTLANNLSDHHDSLLLENHEQNIYWKSPRANLVSGFLAYELSFLLQHQYLVAAELSQKTSDLAICDWSFETDRLWASMRLSKKDFFVYNLTYRQLVRKQKPPTIYLYLCLTAQTIYERLNQRDRVGEKFSISDVIRAVKHLDNLVLSLSSSKVLRVGNDVEAASIRSEIDSRLKERKK